MNEAGFDARRRLAHLEQVIELQWRLLKQAGDRLAALERQRVQAQEPEPAKPAARFIPIARAAETAGLSVRTLKRLAKRGDLIARAAPVTGSRPRWLVREDSLATFLSRGARNAETRSAARARMAT